MELYDTMLSDQAYTLCGAVTYVGRSSMEIAVDVLHGRNVADHEGLWDEQW